MRTFHMAVEQGEGQLSLEISYVLSLEEPVPVQGP